MYVFICIEMHLFTFIYIHIYCEGGGQPRGRRWRSCAPARGCTPAEASSPAQEEDHSYLT